MTDWKKICCAVDFAEPSRIAMEHAAELAKRFEAELVLVHVVVPPPPAASDILVSSRGVATAAAEEHERTLEEWRLDAERRAARPVRARVLSGDPAAEVLRQAREERCDLVVVGTHGRTGLKRLVLGSVAARIARESACPVLVVRAGEAEEAARH
jgi:nucleotide-binding universal stress UspA family protein